MLRVDYMVLLPYTSLLLIYVRFLQETKLLFQSVQQPRIPGKVGIVQRF